MGESLANLLQTRRADPMPGAAEREAAALLLDAIRAGEPVILLTGQFGADAVCLLDATLAALGSGDPRVIRLAPPFPTARGAQQRLQALLDGAAVDSLAEPAQVAQELLLLPQPSPGVPPVTIVVDRAETAPEPLLRYLWLMHSLTNLGRVTLQLVLAGRDTAGGTLAAPSLGTLRAAVSLRLVAPPPAAPLALPSMGEVLGASLPQGDLAPLPLAAAKATAPRRAAPVARTHRYVAAGIVACLGLAAIGAWQIAGHGPGSRVVKLPRPVVATAAAPQAPPPPRVALAAPVATRPNPKPSVTTTTTTQARFDLASLQQKPASLLDGWAPRTPPQPAAAAKVATSAPPSSPVATKPRTSDALPPLGPVVRVSVPVLPPALRSATQGSKTPAVAAPLLVMGAATVPKVTVLFGLGDARGLAQATRAVQVLRRDGLPVSDPQAAARPVAHPGIGYFFAADRPAAELVARSLAPLIGAAAIQVLPLPPELPPPGAIRVVIGAR